jgi:hypothetical protein
LPSPKKAIKHIVAIVLSPVKVRPQKECQRGDLDESDNAVVLPIFAFALEILTKYLFKVKYLYAGARLWYC